MAVGMHPPDAEWVRSEAGDWLFLGQALLATVLMAVPIVAALGFGLCLNLWHLSF